MFEKETKKMTLCMVHNSAHILLGMKKRGFGVGRWNGFGGKVEHDETIENAALRELKEEIKITALDIVKRGILNFKFSNDPIILEVHVFSVNDFTGTPTETEEIKPQWFKLSEIPFQDMWPDDRYWIPFLLRGKNFGAHFYFKNINEVLWHKIKEVSSFDNIPAAI